MSSRIDLPVRYEGRVGRFIASGGKGAIFSKNGDMVKVLDVPEPARGRRVPDVFDEAGDKVQLSVTSRPCSCIGGAWSKSFSELESRLGELQ